MLLHFETELKFMKNNDLRRLFFKQISDVFDQSRDYVDFFCDFSWMLPSRSCATLPRHSKLPSEMLIRLSTTSTTFWYDNNCEIKETKKQLSNFIVMLFTEKARVHSSEEDHTQ